MLNEFIYLLIIVVFWAFFLGVVSEMPSMYGQKKCGTQKVNNAQITGLNSNYIISTKAASLIFIEINFMLLKVFLGG